MKVLDFSSFNDQEPDSNGEYTSATLNAGALPESFTICSAILTEAWTDKFTSAIIFQLLDVYVSNVTDSCVDFCTTVHTYDTLALSTLVSSRHFPSLDVSC